MRQGKAAIGMRISLAAALVFCALSGAAPGTRAGQAATGPQAGGAVAGGAPVSISQTPQQIAITGELPIRPAMGPWEKIEDAILTELPKAAITVLLAGLAVAVFT